MFWNDAWEYHGEHFDFPLRNVIPKPRQKPHPPLWVACSRRDTIHMAAQHAIGHRREQERNGDPRKRHQHAEERRNLKGLEVVTVPEERAEVREPDELRFQAEGVLQLERIPNGLGRGPEEEHDGDRDLRRHQHVRQPRRPEQNPLFHGLLRSTYSPLRTGAGCRCRASPRRPAPASLPSCPRTPPPVPPRLRCVLARNCRSAGPWSSPSAACW